MPLDVIIKGSTELWAAFPPLLGWAWGTQPPRVTVMDGVITGLAQRGVRPGVGHGSLSCRLLGYSLWEGGVDVWG